MQDANHPYSVAIIGAGQIAAGYDQPTSYSVLTHAHAIQRNPAFQCVGLFDLDPKRADQAAKKWGIPRAESWESLFEKKPDVVVSCVPDPAHLEVLEKVLPYRPKVVLAEKPLTTRYADSIRICKEFEKAGIELLVNFQRRVEPSVTALKKEIASGSLGKILAAHVFYSKGLLHNGSHAIDLLRYILGEPIAGIKHGIVDDYTDADPTVDGALFFENTIVHLIAGNEKKFSVFEIDFTFEKKRVRFVHSGLEMEDYDVRPDSTFPGYFELEKRMTGPTQLNRALVSVYAEIESHLRDGSSLSQRARDVVHGQFVCETLSRAPFHEKVALHEGRDG